MPRLGLLALAFIAFGCDSGARACTLVGCGDSASVVVTTSDGMWTDGAYEIDFELGGQTHTCTLELPEDAPQAMGPSIESVELPCDYGFEARFQPKIDCTEERVGDTLEQRCRWVPDSWFISTSVRGVVESLRVAVRRDGATVFERTVAPEYRQERPNGPDCDPVCQLAEVELTID